MLQSFLGCGTAQGVDFEQPSDEVEEVRILALQTLLEGGLLGDEHVDFELFVIGFGRLLHLAIRFLAATLIISVFNLLVNETFSREEVLNEAAFLHHILREWSNNSDNSAQETLNRLVLEQHIAGEKLSQDTSKRPNINLVVILAAQDNLWRSVTSRLHIGAQVVMNEAARSEINHLDLRSRVTLNQDILWLQVTMDQLEVVDVRKCSQNLLGDDLQAGNREVGFLFGFTVVLAVFIQIVAQQLCHDEQMLLVVEEVNQPEQVLPIEILAVSVNVPQKLDFINGLVEVVLVVLNDLHAHHLLGVDVVALDCLTESS